MDSIIAQTYDSFEIIVIDDCSTDSTNTILQKYLHAEWGGRQFILKSNSSNKGVSYCRNLLISQASGEFVIFVDSDDYIEPSMIQRLVESINSNTSVVCCSHNEVLLDSRKICKKYDYSVLDKYKAIELFARRYITPQMWAKLIRKSCFEGITFDTNIKQAEDVLVMWSIISNCHEVILLPDVLYNYVANPDSIVHKPISRKNLNDVEVWYRILQDCEEKYPKFKNLVYCRYIYHSCCVLYAIWRSGFRIHEDVSICKSIRNRFYIVFEKKNRILPFSTKLKIFYLLVIFNTSFAKFLARRI